MEGQGGSSHRPVQAQPWREGARVPPVHAGNDPLTNEELLLLECTVLIPAALERVITKEIAASLKCRFHAEAANGPTAASADEVLGKLFDILDKARYNVEDQREQLGISRRNAALTLGIERVARAKVLRGIFPQNQNS